MVAAGRGFDRRECDRDALAVDLVRDRRQRVRQVSRLVCRDRRGCAAGHSPGRVVVDGQMRVAGIDVSEQRQPLVVDIGVVDQRTRCATRVRAGRTYLRGVNSSSQTQGLPTNAVSSSRDTGEVSHSTIPYRPPNSPRFRNLSSQQV